MTIASQITLQIYTHLFTISYRKISHNWAASRLDLPGTLLFNTGWQLTTFPLNSPFLSVWKAQHEHVFLSYKCKLTSNVKTSHLVGIYLCTHNYVDYMTMGWYMPMTRLYYPTLKMVKYIWSRHLRVSLIPEIITQLRLYIDVPTHRRRHGYTGSAIDVHYLFQALCFIHMSSKIN